MEGGAGIGVGVSLPPHLLGVESAFSQLVTSLLLRSGGDTSPPSPSSSTLVWVGSFLPLPVTPGKSRVWGVEICVGTLPLWALWFLSSSLGPSCPAVLPASPGRGCTPRPPQRAHWLPASSECQTHTQTCRPPSHVGVSLYSLRHSLALDPE